MNGIRHGDIVIALSLLSQWLYIRTAALQMLVNRKIVQVLALNIWTNTVEKILHFLCQYSKLVARSLRSQFN